MRSLLITLLSTLAIAAPSPTPRSSSCMTTPEANKVAQNFKDLINLPFSTRLANTVLTPTFTDYSDSVNELINAGCSKGPKPLGLPTFTSRKDFIDSQGTQLPIRFEILNVWHTCCTVIMRWRTRAPGSVRPEQEVTGIVVMETEANGEEGSGEPWLISTVYSEFNSGAWLYDVGNFTATCSSNVRRSNGFARRSIDLRPGFDGRTRLF